MLTEPPGLAEFRKQRQSTFYPKSDLPFDPAEVRELLARKRQLIHEFAPLIKDRSTMIFGQPADAVEALPELGTFHSIYKIRVGTRNWMMRADMLGVWGRACDLLIDRQISQILRSRDFPVVEMLGTDLERTVLPFDFQVMAEAPGCSARELEDRDTQALPEGLIYQMGALMANVHEWNAAGAGLLDPYFPLSGVLSKWPDYILPRLEEHVRICKTIGAISEREGNEIHEWFKQAEGLLRSAPIKLLHGDWGHHNIFVENGKITAVIDWEDALAGDPVFDIAYWGTFVRAEMTGEFTRGYIENSPGEWPADFDRRYWLYYLRIALSKTVHRHLFSRTDRPGRPPASKRIQWALTELREVWN